MNTTKCPNCGCEEIAQGKQGGFAVMKTPEKVAGSEIIADICTDCGLIIATRVSEPEKFKIKKIDESVNL